MSDSEPILVPLEAAGERLDQFLVRHFAAQDNGALSRSQIAKSVAQGGATVSGEPRKASYRLTPGEIVRFAGVAPRAEGPQPEAIALDILYEDDDIAVINKPCGMVVHPAKGHWHGTLASALAGRYGPLSDVGGAQRPGIVHRLDRDTSGVIVIARHNRAHLELARQFASREVKKEYQAITRGEPNYDRDWIDLPIAPHPRHRERMAISHEHPERREARTFYEVQARFAGFCHLQLEPVTGRTHQIRVHLADLGTPVLCDPLYGDPRPLTQSELLHNRRDDESPVILSRLALHAARLRLAHPTSGEPLEFHAPLPDPLAKLLQLLSERPDPKKASRR